MTQQHFDPYDVKDMEKRRQRHYKVMNVTGVVSLIIAVSLVAVLARSAVTAINRQADQRMYMIALQMSQNAQPQSQTVIPASQPVEQQTDVSSDTEKQDTTSSDAERSDSQTDWAVANDIVWDAYGNPVDKYGVVQDDPSTEVNELEVAKANGTYEKSLRLVQDKQTGIIGDAASETRPSSTGASIDADNSESGTDTDKTDTTSQEPVVTQTGSENATSAEPNDGQTNVSSSTETSTKTQNYVIQRGDSVNKIAARFGVSADAIIGANHLTNPNLIITGQTLVIPGVTAENASGGTATVTNGASGSGLG